MGERGVYWMGWRGVLLDGVGRFFFNEVGRVILDGVGGWVILDGVGERFYWIR